MRKFLLACLAILPTLSQAQTAPPATTLASARVSSSQGKFVFCYAQPQAAYDVVFTFAATFQATEAMTLNTLISATLTAALTEAGAQLKAFDAVLIQAGARDVAIKFRDNVPQAERALALVQRNQGKYMYVFCEPVADYQVLGTEKISWYNHLFGGSYYTIGHVEENLLKTAKKKNPKIEGVVIGETATYVAFSK